MIPAVKTDYALLNREMTQRAQDRLHVAEMLRALDLCYGRVTQDLAAAQAALDEARAFLNSCRIQMPSTSAVDLVDEWRPSW